MTRCLEQQGHSTEILEIIDQVSINYDEIWKPFIILRFNGEDCYDIICVHPENECTGWQVKKSLLNEASYETDWALVHKSFYIRYCDLQN